LRGFLAALLLLAGMMAGRTAVAADASATPSSPAGDPAFQIGLCQCIADRTTRNLFCAAGTAKCQAACSSTHYGFIPLGEAAVQRCSPTEVYVVLPNADGRPGSGAINVSQGGRTALLDQPFAAAGALNGAAAGIGFDQQQTDRIFGRAIAARPILPKHFRLFFESGNAQVTPDSVGEYQAIMADIKRRPVYEVDLVGHTDTVASETANKELSINRANAVRQTLVRDGVSAATITTAGRGETQLLVPTTKNVAEPRNRRVEVTVR
jgi:outer membrane protein OmpA-like peptidoglycan-associated protein